MNTFRLPAAALAVSTLFAVAWSFGAEGCGPEGNGIVSYNCLIPTVGETGADGGPDPCHCNVPAPNQAASCPCTSSEISGDPGVTWMQLYQACMNFLAEDAGNSGDAAEGGPLALCSVPPCSGQCWPTPPVPNWTGPLVMSVEVDGGTAECPDASPAPVYGGYGTGTFAIACMNSLVSGTCADGQHVCGPESAQGFLTCVLQAGDVGCPLVGPYGPDAGRYVFYDGTTTPVPSTFCCITLDSSTQ